MTRPTDDPLRKALAFYTDDANWRQNGPLDPNSANFTGGPARAALAAAPQPAPAPAPTLDERSAMLAVIHKVLDGSLRPTDIADTILAAGWTRGGDAAGLREDDPKVQRLIKAAERFAGWTIGGKIVEDPENREKYPLLVAEVLELREALAALARPSTPDARGPEGPLFISPWKEPRT